MDIIKLEESILKFWKDKDIFKKSLKKNKSQGKRYVFYDGPPTANGRPGIHHLIGRVFKDLWPRFKTMQGYYVERRAGWDTQGIPVELEVEKKLGFKNKKDIEEYGIAEFNRKAKESVWEYKEEWEKFVSRTGHWIDLEDHYITYENDYLESLWSVVKEFDKRGHLFKGHKVLPWCTRCGTALSSHEVADGYKEVTNKSVYFKLKITDHGSHTTNKKLQKLLQDNTVYLTAWTTTPWTLPGNAALAVGSPIDYSVIMPSLSSLDTKPFYYIVATNLVQKMLGEDTKTILELKGSDLIGLEYEPLFDVKPLKSYKSYKVYDADFVTTEDGTGIVHTAVVYGEDDYQLGIKIGLPKHHSVDPQGKFTEDVRELAGMYVNTDKTEQAIFNHLKKNNALIKVEDYKHTYPHCWRCKTPLLYYARDSWFIRMSELRKELNANNKTIKWYPSHLRDGRFGEFLKEAKDWAFSRERYWGTPLPIWECQSCDKYKIIGSIKELPSKPKDEKGNLDLHRPYIDGITMLCSSCNGVMHRVKDVADVWFDSGAMPYAQWHYLFSYKGGSVYDTENKKTFEQNYPADFIAEAIDQTRGWFYTLLATATALGRSAPYKNVISYGHLLDKHGKKMSKSIGNIVDPWEVLNEYGADATRWYFYTVNSPGDSKLFDIDDVKQQLRGYIMTMLNTLRFFELYGGIRPAKIVQPRAITDLLDQWILSRLNNTVKTVTTELEVYNPTTASRALHAFVVNDLSNWWIRRSRSKFQKVQIKSEYKKNLNFLRYLLAQTSKLMAPFTPFVAEHIYRTVSNDKESVHLESWIKHNNNALQPKLERDMALIRKVVAGGLAVRKEKRLKVRQPLASITTNKRLPTVLRQYVMDELNIKVVKYNNKQRLLVKLDTKITAILKREGYARDIIRAIQDLRKKSGYNFDDKVKAYWSCTDKEIIATLNEYMKSIMTDTLLKSFEHNETSHIDASDTIQIGDKQLWLGVKS